MARVVQLELLAKDPGRTARFYEEAPGWKANTWTGSPRPDNDPGIHGALLNLDLGDHF